MRVASQPSLALVVLCSFTMSCLPRCARDGDSFTEAPDSGDSGTRPDSSVDSGDSAVDSGDSRGEEPDPYIRPDVWVTPTEPLPGQDVTVHYTGWLLETDSVTMRLSFNGDNKIEDYKDELTCREAERNTVCSLDLEMQRNLQTEYRARLQLPSDARVMHMSFFEDEGDFDTWDDNDDLKYHWAVEFPSIGPYLTWTEGLDPSEGVVVNFTTDVACLGTVEFGPDETLGNEVLGEEPSTIHHITLDGLQPDTRYHYRVRDSQGRLSPIHSFETLPREPSSYRFVVLADLQDDGEDAHFSEVVDAVIDTVPDAAFMVAPGDLAFCDRPGPWWTFFDTGEALFSTRVMLPAPGNHDLTELSNESYRRYFPASASGDETRYRIDVGSASFLSLDSEDDEGLLEGSEQLLWLGAQLEALAGDADRTWAFAFWHRPPYTVDWRHAEDMEALRPLVEHFDGVIDWHFSGHDHLYQRSIPLRWEAEPAPSGQYGNGETDGVGYIVVPSGGDATYSRIVPEGHPRSECRQLMAYPTIEEGQSEVDSELGFVAVTLDGPSIQIETWALGTLEDPVPPHLIDSVSYTK
jgi:hypothetical protein